MEISGIDLCFDVYQKLLAEVACATSPFFLQRWVEVEIPITPVSHAYVMCNSLSCFTGSYAGFVIYVLANVDLNDTMCIYIDRCTLTVEPVFVQHAAYPSMC
jgi:hypothetical protein